MKWSYQITMCRYTCPKRSTMKIILKAISYIQKTCKTFTTVGMCFKNECSLPTVQSHCWSSCIWNVGIHSVFLQLFFVAKLCHMGVSGSSGVGREIIVSLTWAHKEYSLNQWKNNHRRYRSLHKNSIKPQPSVFVWYLNEVFSEKFSNSVRLLGNKLLLCFLS